MREVAARRGRYRYVISLLDSRVRGLGSGPRLEIYLLGVVATLIGLGVLMVFSASYAAVGTRFFLAQLKWAGVGACALIIMAAIPYQFWHRVAVPVIAVTILALIAVLLSSTSTFGAQRTLAGGRVQPSELAKLSVVIYFASWVSARGRSLADFKRGFLPFAIMIETISCLILLEPSMTVAVIVLVIGLTIYYVGGASRKQLLLLSAISALVLSFAMWQAGYPLVRVLEWFQLWFNPTQAPQELLEITSLLRARNGIGTDPTIWAAKASVFGLWSDFIFANIGSDLGPMGLLGTVSLFIALCYLGLQVAKQAPDRFGSLLAVGITTWIMSQATVHIGASVALIPTTGVPLPFISYGGSALVTAMAGVGLLLSISRKAYATTLALRVDEPHRNEDDGSAVELNRDTVAPARITPQELDDILGPVAIRAPWMTRPNTVSSLANPQGASNEVSVAKNPFGDLGRITDPDRFFGRDALMQRVFEELTAGANLWLTGARGTGKSSVLAMICALGPDRLHRPATDFAYLSLACVENEGDFFGALANALGLKAEVRGYALKASLAGRRVVVCLDDVDTTNASYLGGSVGSQLRGLADGKDAQVRLVLAGRARFDHDDAERPVGGASLADICRWLPVDPFAPDIARAFLVERLAGTTVTFTEAQIAGLIMATGGLPGDLQRAAAELCRSLD